MMVFLKSKGLDVGDLVSKGPYVLKKLVDREYITKTKEEWSELDRRMISLNNKEMHIPFCTSKTQFKKV